MYVRLNQRKGRVNNSIVYYPRCYSSCIVSLVHSKSQERIAFEINLKAHCLRGNVAKTMSKELEEKVNLTLNVHITKIIIIKRAKEIFGSVYKA